MSTHENQVKTSNTTSHAAIDLCCETIMVGVGFPTPELMRTARLEGAGLPQLRSDLRDLRGVLEQTGSLGAPTASAEDNNRFSTAHTRLTEKFDGLAMRVVNLTESLQSTPNSPIISRMDSAGYDRTLRSHSQEVGRVIKAANGDLGELHEVTEAARAVGIGESMLAMIRTAAHVAKERIVTTLEGVRSEIRERQRDARRVERALSAVEADLVITDFAPGEFQITTPVRSAACGEERRDSKPQDSAARAELRREHNELLATKQATEREKASHEGLRALGFFARLDAVCERGIYAAIVSGQIMDAMPFVGNRRIERRIAEYSTKLASFAKREKELILILGNSADLSA
jgi:hypothetical protein